MSTKFDATVHYEDGTTAEVTIGQREVASVEAQPFGQSAGTLLRVRYAAYDALRRTGRLPRDRKDRQVDWSAWDDLVDEVTAEEDDAEPDPTRPTPTAEG